MNELGKVIKVTNDDFKAILHESRRRDCTIGDVVGDMVEETGLVADDENSEDGNEDGAD